MRSASPVPAGPLRLQEATKAHPAATRNCPPPPSTQGKPRSPSAYDAGGEVGPSPRDEHAGFPAPPRAPDRLAFAWADDRAGGAGRLEPAPPRGLGRGGGGPDPFFPGAGGPLHSHPEADASK
jgi:hypothetical protein